jgi:CheY-like chemotaxis protein
VVDDDLDTCANLSDVLTDVGYRVDVADGGDTALMHARRQPYDMALLDWRMPDMDGLMLCRRLKQLIPELVALIITGYPALVERDEARAAGARHVLAKPIEVPTLLSLMQEGLARPN